MQLDFQELSRSDVNLMFNLCLNFDFRVLQRLLQPILGMEEFGRADAMESSKFTVVTDSEQPYATKRYDLWCHFFAVWRIGNEKHTKWLIIKLCLRLEGRVINQNSEEFRRSAALFGQSTKKTYRSWYIRFWCELALNGIVYSKTTKRNEACVEYKGIRYILHPMFWAWYI